MEFCLKRTAKPVVATAAFALMLTSPFAIRSLSAQAPAPAAGAPATGATKNWKDRAEYDLYSQIIQAKDPAARLKLLNTWQDKYPTTDYADDRSKIFLATYGQMAGSDPSSRQKLLDSSKGVLDKSPNDFQALYFTSLYGPAVGGASPSPDVVTQVDTAAHGLLNGAIDTQFDAKNKPPTMQDADWTKAKSTVTAIAHNALAWESTTKKDMPTAESEYQASLTANPGDSATAYKLAQLYQNDKKYSEALFEYARAGTYDGPGAIPVGNRPAVLAYFNKIYGQFHGSPDGADKVLDASKGSAVPPPGFKIEGQGDLEAQKAKAINDRIASDPSFKIWEAIKQNLQQSGDTFFTSSVKEVDVPGKAVPGVDSFNGTVVSVDPADKPTKITVGVEDPSTADATLDFSEAVTPTTPLKAGDKIQFSGVAESYTKDPYMLTFKDPVVPGLKTSAAPKKTTPTRKRKR